MASQNGLTIVHANKNNQVISLTFNRCWWKVFRLGVLKSLTVKFSNLINNIWVLLQAQNLINI